MFTHNIRELEGALRRFITYCVSMNTPFTVENVYSILESIAPKQNKDFKDQTDQKIMVVKKIVAPYFQISEEDLVS